LAVVKDYRPVGTNNAYYGYGPSPQYLNPPVQAQGKFDYDAAVRQWMKVMGATGYPGGPLLIPDAPEQPEKSLEDRVERVCGDLTNNRVPPVLVDRLADAATKSQRDRKLFRATR
jgi:hypothetical protein